MNEAFKLLLDECIGKQIASALRAFLAPTEESAVIKHLLELHKPGTLDDVWLPEAAKDGWIILTGDRGKRASKGSKLPRLCRLLGITHVMLSASIHRMTTLDKQRMIISAWHDLRKLADAPRGSGYQLQKAGLGSRLKPVYVPDPNQPR